MDKQMIEEMARIIAFDLCPNRYQHIRWGEEAQCYSDNNFAECTKIKNVVDKLYNAGYRKIPENAVVLTREEYEKLKSNQMPLLPIVLTEKQYTDLKLEAVLARKETAEKFALKLADYFVEHCGGKLCLSLTLQEWYKMIDEIAKEIKEVKECQNK
jgi:hypothetical protein